MKMVIETSRPIARVAKELGINEGTLGNWGVPRTLKGVAVGGFSDAVLCRRWGLWPFGVALRGEMSNHLKLR